MKKVYYPFLAVAALLDAADKISGAGTLIQRSLYTMTGRMLTPQKQVTK